MLSPKPPQHNCNYNEIIWIIMHTIQDSSQILTKAIPGCGKNFNGQN